MTSFSYDTSSDQLTVHFQMYPTNEALNDFVDTDGDRREQTLTTQVQQLARLADVVDAWGLLRSMTLNSTKPLDSDAIRAAVAARTVLHLHVTYGSKIYTASRDMDGLFDIEMTERRTN